MEPSSSRVIKMEHDVFISFRGEVRLGLLSVLENELCGMELDVYVDRRLERGVDILPTLFREIERSQILLVIFSQDYASSTWCLEELAKMVECKEKNKQILIPVFYEVSPSDVRKQNGDYGSALAKHEEKHKEKVQIWRSALEKAAKVSGFHYPSNDIESEAKLVEKIVECVFKKLKNMVQLNTEAILTTTRTSDSIISKPDAQHSKSQRRKRKKGFSSVLLL